MWKVMEQSVLDGANKEGVLMGGLGVKKKRF